MYNVTYIFIGLLTITAVQTQNHKHQVDQQPSFVKHTHAATGKAGKSEKNVAQKVIDTAKAVTDSIADVVVSLVTVGKEVSDVSFQAIEKGDKKELNLLYKSLQECQKELLEIQLKIDTLQVTL